MADASLTPIYERLHGTSGYHPFNAQMFADWSIEAGDTVTIKRGSDSYNSPIHVSRMVWKGTPQVSIEATGHRNRDPIARMSLRKYGRSGSGLRNSREMYLFAHDMYDEDGILHASIYATVESFHMAYENLESSLRGEIVVTAQSLTSAFEDTANSLRGQITQTAQSLTTAFEDQANSLHSEIVQTASTLSSAITDTANSLRSQITQTASSLTSRFEDQANSLHSEIVQTASTLSSTITDTASSLRSSIQQNASRIGLVVDGNGIKAAQIIAAVNDTGSEVLLSANHVRISGDTTLSGVLTIDNGALVVKKSSTFQGSITVTGTNSYIQSPLFTVPSNGQLRFVGSGTGEYYNVTTAILKNMVKSFSVVDNTLTLTPFYGNPVTFSKATSLTGAWGSGEDAGKYIVTASPQDVQLKFDPPMRLNGSGSANNFSAEITETVGSTTYARKSIYGYIVLKGSGASASASVNTENDGSGTDVAVLPVGSLYTSGQNVTTITGPTWTNTPSSGITGNSNTATFSTNAPTPKTKSLALYLSRSDGWVNNVRYVYVSHTDSSDTNRVARIDVDASSLVSNATTAGKNSVKVTGPTWATTPASGITGNSNTATFTTDAPTPNSGAAKSLALYLSRSDSWSNNVRYVYVSHTDSSAANRIARIDVDASSLVSNATTAGKNSAKVTGPTWATTPASTITGNSNTATFTTDADSPVSGAAKSLALYMNQGSWSSNKKYVYVTHTNSTDANRIARVEVDASTLVSNATTAGKNSAKVTGPTWSTTPASTITGNSNTATFTTDADSPVSGAAKSLALYMSQGSWSSNKKYVYVTHTNSTDGNRIARVEVDASTLVTNATYAGKAAVTLNDPTWNAVTGTTPANRTVTVSTTGRTNTSGTTDNLSKSVALYLTQGSWSSNKLTVSMRAGSNSGTVYAQTTVDAGTLVSNATTAGKNSAKVTGPTWSTTPSSSITGNSNTATFTTDAASPVSGAAKSLSLYMNQGSFSSHKKYVYVTHTSSADANRIARIEVDATSEYSAGQKDTRDSVSTVPVTLVDGVVYDSGTSKYMQSGKATVTFSNGQTQVTNVDCWGGVDVTVAYNSGRNAVSINNPTWTTTPASNITGNSNTATFKTNAPTQSSKSLSLYLSRSDSWSNNVRYVYVSHTDSSAANRVARIDVDASGIYTNGQQNAWDSLYRVPVELSGGIVYDGNTHKYMQHGDAYVQFSNGQSEKTVDCWGGVDVTDAYSAGWNAARNASEVPTGQDLNATSVTVKRPSPTVGGGSTPYTYALSVTNSYAQLKYGTTVICQVPLSAQPSATISAAYVSLSGEPVPNSSGGQSMSGSVSITYSNGTTTSHNCDGGVDVTVAYNAGKAQNPSYAHSATLTRYRAGAVESIIPGIMYRKESNGTYTALGSSSTYWYASSTNMGSSKVVAYN